MGGFTASVATVAFRRGVTVTDEFRATSGGSTCVTFVLLGFEEEVFEEGTFALTVFGVFIGDGFVQEGF